MIRFHLSDLVSALPPPVLNLPTRKLNDVLQHLQTPRTMISEIIRGFVIIFIDYEFNKTLNIFEFSK